jgi:hypothetical protein
MAGSPPDGFLLGAVTGVPLCDAPVDEVALAVRVDVGLFEMPGGGDCVEDGVIGAVWVDVPVGADVGLFEVPGGGDCVKDGVIGGVWVGVPVGALVPVFEADGSDVGVGDGDRPDVPVGVCVGVPVPVGVGDAVIVVDGVFDGVRVGVFDGVSVHSPSVLHSYRGDPGTVSGVPVGQPWLNTPMMVHVDEQHSSPGNVATMVVSKMS